MKEQFVWRRAADVAATATPGHLEILGVLDQRVAVGHAGDVVGDVPRASRAGAGTCADCSQSDRPYSRRT